MSEDIINNPNQSGSESLPMNDTQHLLAIFNLQHAIPINSALDIKPDADIKEQLQKTPLGLDRKAEDLEILTLELERNGINPNDFAEMMYRLYLKAGEPRFVKDLSDNIPEIANWKLFLDTGEDLAITSLVLSKENGKKLTSREEELIRRIQDNTSIHLTFPSMTALYPEDLRIMAQRCLDIKDQLFQTDKKLKLDYLKLKLDVEVSFLKILMQNNGVFEQVQD
jgi:hypothetical protein